MGFFSNVFGNKEVVNKAVDGIYQGIDKAILTDEEKLDFKNLDKEMFLKGAELKIKLNESFHPYKLMQRFIALLFVVPFIVFYCIGMLYLIKGHKDIADVIFNYNTKTMGTTVMMVVTFYYSGSILDKLKR